MASPKNVFNQLNLWTTWDSAARAFERKHIC